MSRLLTDRRRLVAGFGTLPLAWLVAGCAAGPLATPASVRVKAFPGFQNLPLYIAVEQGFFERQGLAVDLRFTRTSVELRDELATGRVDIAHAAVDNAVAMREVAGHDIVVFMGGDDGLNELFVQPEIRSVEQLRNGTLIVDAPDTAYALQARKILLDRGLRTGDYQIRVAGGTFQRVRAMIDDRANSASMLNPPFSFQASDAGLRSLGSVADLIGPYQGSSGFAMRPWARANGELLVRYVAGYVAALRWSLDPTHRAQAVDLLRRKLDLSAPVAERSYAALADPRRGLARDARLDFAGFATTLALRAELEGLPSAKDRKPDRYVELTWYDQALGRL